MTQIVVTNTANKPKERKWETLSTPPLDQMSSNPSHKAGLRFGLWEPCTGSALSEASKASRTAL